MAGRPDLSTTGIDRRALALAAENAELRTLVADLGDRNARLLAERNTAVERSDTMARHLRGFIVSLGCTSLAEVAALLSGVSRPTNGSVDLDELVRRRSRP